MAEVLARYRFRRGTAAAWASENPVLQAGEPGFETDTKILRIGDGTSVFTALERYTTLDDVTPQLGVQYGDTPPAGSFPGSYWMDTSGVEIVVKQRNAADDAWITVGEFVDGAYRVTDATALRTTGNQTAAGAKTFTGAAVFREGLSILKDAADRALSFGLETAASLRARVFHNDSDNSLRMELRHTDGATVRAMLQMLPDGQIRAHTGRFTGPILTLDSNSPTIDLATGNAFKRVFTGDGTIGAPSNMVEGQTIYLFIQQDATGGRMVSWDATWLFLDGEAPDLGTAAGQINLVVGVVYHDLVADALVILATTMPRFA
jgi:hypothetical protein